MSDFLTKSKPMMGSLIDYGHFLSHGLIGCWLMNENKGNVIYDISGWGRHLSFGGDANWNKEEHCVNFPTPDNDYLGTVDVNGPKRFTVIGWVRIANDSIFHTILSWCADAGSGADEGLWFGFDPSSGAGSRIYYYSKLGLNFSADTSYSINDGEFHQLTLSYDGVAVRYGLDGKYFDSDAVSGDPTYNVLSGDNTLCIGSIENGSIYGHDGDIGTVSIYDHAITDFELSQLYTEPYCFISGGRRRKLFIAEEIAAGGVVQAAGEATITTSSLAGMRRLNIPGAGTATVTTASYAGCTGGAVSGVEEILRYRRFNSKKLYGFGRVNF